MSKRLLGFFILTKLLLVVVSLMGVSVGILCLDGGTIYIRADGSIDPPTAAISTIDNVTYTFTDNIYDQISVEKSNVIVDGNQYTLQGSGAWSGIDLSGVYNVTIRNTKIRNFNYGISIFSSSDCSIHGNAIVNNNGSYGAGIRLLDFSDYNDISRNNITKNGLFGVYLSESSFNTISLNNITNNGFYGGIICYYSSTHNTISRNNIINNSWWGIHLDSSDYNSVSANNIKNNNFWGVDLRASNNTFSRNTIASHNYGISIGSPSSDNLFWGNNITRNARGVYILQSSGNTFSENLIESNTEHGIAIYVSSNDNRFFHNDIIDNAHQVSCDEANIWDDSYPSGGNYWSDYVGVDLYSGPYQNETGSDGIGDTAYLVDDGNRDNYPLMRRWYSVHNIHSRQRYHTIQEAIDAPETLDGHTIYVEAGIYYEHLWIHKSLSLVGEDKLNTIVDGSNTGFVISVHEINNINITGFTLQRSSASRAILLMQSTGSNISHNIIMNNEQDGIYLESLSNSTISGNTITNNGKDGVSLSSYSNNNTVSGNTITNNGRIGVYLDRSSYNGISGNTITNNGYSGIYVDESSNNNISGNTIANNGDFGVFLEKSSYNGISGNTITNNTGGGIGGYSLSHYNALAENNITNNYWGVWLSSSSYNIVSENNIANSKYYGVDLGSSAYNVFSRNNITNSMSQWGLTLSGSSHNTFSENIIKNNPHGVDISSSSNYNIFTKNNVTNNTANGIYLSSSSLNNISENTLTYNQFSGVYLRSASNNTISGNTITNNDEYGLRTWESSHNKIYHNTIMDNNQQVYSDEASTNVWDDGYPSGGNYWNDYAGNDTYSGPGQDEAGTDGMGDSPYIIDVSNQDNYPLMIPWGCPVSYESNTTITNVTVTTSALDFGTSGPDGTIGYINVTMPINFNTTAVKVFVNDIELIPPPFPTITKNTTHYFIYFEFDQSTNNITIQYAPIINIAITNITTLKTVVGQSLCASINVTIANQGDYTESFNVTLYANTTIIETKEIILTSRNSTTLTFTWNTTIVKGNYTINAHMTSVPNEISTTDNTLTDGWVIVATVGDITGPDGWPDRKCDIRDVALVAKIFGAIYPNPEYDPNCDLTGPTTGVPDGKIDIRDVALVAVHFGDIDP